MPQLFFHRANHEANIAAGNDKLPVWQLHHPNGTITVHHSVAGDGWVTKYQPFDKLPAEGGVVAWIEIAGPVVVK